MKIEGYEEISNEEYGKLPANEAAYFRDLKEDKNYYFKKVQELPIKLPRCPNVFIERAALCTVEGIRAICGTDKEYSEYVEKIKKEKVQEFPIVFEDKWRLYKIDKETFRVYDKVNEISISFHKNGAFPLLVKAVEKAKEVVNKK